MKRIIISALLLLAAVAAFAQKPDPVTPIPIVEPEAWDWVTSVFDRPQLDLLVSFRIKEAFGARNHVSSIQIKSVALYRDAAPDTMLNELIAALTKAGLLDNIKGLGRPKQASITILGWQRVHPEFIYTTETE